MKRADFTYSADAYGYMIVYKGKEIGGVGTDGRPAKHWRHARADSKMFNENAKQCIRDLLAGKDRKSVV